MRSGQTLMGFLVALVILLGVFLYFYYRPERRKETSRLGQETPYRAAIQRARAFACQNDLYQLRLLIRQYQAERGTNPPSLRTLQLPKGVTSFCPVTKMPYIYDPQRALVKCPRHPRF